MKMKNKITFFVNIFCIAISLLVVSCVDGFKESELFSSGVTNTSLESPDSLTFTPSADGSTVTISWPVVYGAGGYQVSLYKVDDPANPVVIGTENQIVDGCSFSRELLSDTKYKAVVKTLGNASDNNQESTTSREATYSTYTKATAVIPAGTDLYEYFVAHPITSSTSDQIYELEAGGNYTMTGNVSTGLVNVTFRGDKVHRPTVKMTSGVFLSDGGGLNFKVINFDCSLFLGNSFITFNPTQNASVVSSGAVIVTAPVTIQSCNITDLSTRLIWDSGKKYSLQTVVIKDCIVGQNAGSTSNVATQVLIFIPGGGIIKDLSLTNSTFYNKQSCASYFIQYSNIAVGSASNNLWASAGVAINNCTFWQVAKTGQMANYSGMAKAGNYLTIQKCIFVDCGSQQVIRRFTSSSTNMTRTYGYNSYWYGGAFSSAEISTSNDNSSTYINTDPKLKDPANLDFTVQGATQLGAATGDPRWLQ